MSTLFPGLRTKCLQSEVKPDRGGSVSVGDPSPGREPAGASRDARKKKRVTRTSSECIHTAKNLHLRPGTLLKGSRERISTEGDRDEGRGQLRFTSSFSLRFPFTKNNPRTKVRVATKLKSNERHTESDVGTKIDDVQRPKGFLVDVFRESTGKATEDKDVSDPVYPWESHDHDISSRRSSDGIQHGLALCDQPAETCTQGQSTSVTEPRVNEQESVEGQSGVNDPLGKNAEGKLSHSNLIPFREDTGSKADSTCQDYACSPTAINPTLSLPSFPDSHCVNNLKSDLITSTAAMFSLVSVISPYRSGRLRRHKRAFSDAEPDIVQNPNLPALSPNEQQQQQQRFPLQQIQAQGEPLTEFSNRFRGSAGTRRSSVDWQNESFSHLLESNKPFLKSSALRMNRQAVNQTTEPGNHRHMLLNSGKMSRSSLDLTGDRGESFTSLRSRPTTSTLLLSSRRSNSRNPSSKSFQMEKQLPASVCSLDLPRNSIMRISQPSPNLGFPNDLSKETLVTRSFLASPDTQKPEPSSPRWGESDSSRKQRFLITGDFDRNPPATNTTTKERPFSNYLTRFKQSETLRSAQDHGPDDRSMYDNKNVQNSNSNIPERSAWISPKDNANSRFVFPEVSSHPSSDGILKRQISQTSITNMTLGLNAFVQSNSIHNMINPNSSSNLSGTTCPGTIQTNIKSSSVSLSPASQAHNVQHNIQNSKVSAKPPSSPMNSIRMRTFTESLSFSPRKESPVEGTSPSHLWSNYLNSKGRSEESNQSPSNPLSPSEFKPRRVCTPSIYKYLRQTSPPQASPALVSPLTSSLKQKQEEDKNLKNVRFTFDLNSLESPDSSSTSAPKSLPSDTGRRSMPRISESPYATLISTRAAAIHLTTPPAAHQHSRSYSYDSSPVDATSPRAEKRSYTSVVRDRLSQRTSSVREPMGSTDIQLSEKIQSTCQYGISESLTDAKYPDCQPNTLNPDTTHPKQTDSLVKMIPHDGLNGIFVSHVDSRNTHATDRWNSKELSSPLGPSPVRDVVQKEEVTETLKPNGTVQASPASKWSFFSLKSKKDNALASSLSAEKEGLADRKGEMKGLKSTNRMDQMLNRLRVKFGRISEDSDATSRRKTKKEEASNSKAYESIKKEKESADLTVKRPEELSEHRAPESTRNLEQMDELRIPTKPEKVADIRGPERNQKPNQMYDLVLRPQTKTKEVSDMKDTESGETIDLIYDLVRRTQTKPKEVSDTKGSERSQKLDQANDLTVRTQTKPKEVSGVKGPERNKKLDQTDDLTARTQTKPDEVSDIKGAERSQKKVQMEELTVRRKTKNEMLLGDMPYGSKRNMEQRLSVSRKSPNSLNVQIIESCDFPGSNFKPGKQDNSPNMDENKTLMEDSRSRLLGKPLSPNRLQPEYINCYATLPLGKRSRLRQSPTLRSPFECPSEEEQNDNVFYSGVLREKRNSTPLGEHENADNTGVQNSTGWSSSFVDLKYGMQRSRSVSVSSVVSGRPSGPGRISTGSRQGSVSDLSSLDSSVSKSRHSSINSPAGSPENEAFIGYTSYRGRLSSEGRLRSPDNVEPILLSWDMETDPTPPHSPPHTRRISQISSSSSASNRNSPDSLSPRGFLPSKNYKSTLSAFEESGSESTTDDEYYLNNDDEDEKETEL